MSTTAWRERHTQLSVFLTNELHHQLFDRAVEMQRTGAQLARMILTEWLAAHRTPVVAPGALPPRQHPIIDSTATPILRDPAAPTIIAKAPEFTADDVAAFCAKDTGLYPAVDPAEPEQVTIPDWLVEDLAARAENLEALAAHAVVLDLPPALPRKRFVRKAPPAAATLEPEPPEEPPTDAAQPPTDPAIEPGRPMAHPLDPFGAGEVLAPAAAPVLPPARATPAPAAPAEELPPSSAARSYRSWRQSMPPGAK
jgi:hypothetical protein